jgi:hypothetical protein
MLRGIYGFDHLPRTPAPVLNGAMTAFATYLGYQSTVVNPTGLGVDPDGFIGSYVVAATNVGFDMTGVIPPNPTKVTFGFRMKVLAIYASAHGILFMSDAPTPNSVAYYPLILTAANAPWSQVIGKETYVEITYDFVAFTATMVADGVTQTVTQGNVFSAAVKAAIVAGTFAINFGLSSGLNNRYAIRDFYIVDAVAGDGMTGPLGSQRMYPITLDAAAGAGWTPSAGGTALDTINAALPAAPYVTSPADKTPLVTSLKTTAPDGTHVNGVSLLLSGTSTGDAASVSKIEISQGGSNAPVKFIPVARTVTYGAQIGIYPKAPDGTVWDIAKIDATTLKLTPDTSV